jgi:hypothetical protein
MDSNLSPSKINNTADKESIIDSSLTQTPLSQDADSSELDGKTKVKELDNISEKILAENIANDSTTTPIIPKRSPYKLIYDKALPLVTNNKIVKSQSKKKDELKIMENELNDDTTKTEFTHFVIKEKPQPKSINKQPKNDATPPTIKETRLNKQSSHLARADAANNSAPLKLQIKEDKNSQNFESILVTNDKMKPSKESTKPQSLTTPSRSSSRSKKESDKQKYLSVLRAELESSNDEDDDVKLCKKSKK